MKIVIGTAADCDVTITDLYASPRHAMITDEGGRWSVRDLGSTNGTRIRRGSAEFRTALGGFSVLLKGDVIIVGRTELPPWDLP
jgi:pSer/pThr/pTyr-binding forkhead associated (FHA) protein